MPCDLGNSLVLVISTKKIPNRHLVFRLSFQNLTPAISNRTAKISANYFQMTHRDNGNVDPQKESSNVSPAGDNDEQRFR